MILATCGEWNTHKEGGADITVRFLVPKDMHVERRADLSGEKSVATQQHVFPSSVAEGWTRITDEPDPDRRAGE